MEHQMTPFEGKSVRRMEYEGEMYFSIVDIVEILTDSKDPSDYWTTMKRREKQLPTICRKLKFLAPDGRMRPTDCANTEGVLRIMMSVPSPKAEPFKLWLARVGKEQIEEMDNPELGIERIKALYKAKGYTDEWIETRLKTIDIRKQLTDEWKTRGVNEGQEYSILTAEIARATFGLTPSEHKDLKKLERQNLRDHMTNLELIFTMLGEETTRRIAVNNDAQGFGENYDAAARGGYSTGEARKRYEQTSGEQVVSADNFLVQIEEAKSQNNLPENQD
jgi:DNA-damage-inducible protein D